MKHRELDRQLQSIWALFTRANAACGDDIEMRSHWARYLCVVCAGFLENALRELYSQYCLACAQPSVAKFAARTLEQISNPKTKRFLEVAGNFRSDWKDELKQFVEADGRQDAIDSIMTNRHLIAHGQQSEITVARVREYFEKAVKVVERIEQQCNLA